MYCYLIYLFIFFFQKIKFSLSNLMDWYLMSCFSRLSFYQRKQGIITVGFEVLTYSSLWKHFDLLLRKITMKNDCILKTPVDILLLLL